MWFCQLIRFYPGIGHNDIFGEDPIPTPLLDMYHEKMIKIQAMEGLDLSAAHRCDFNTLRQHYTKILDSRTLKEKRADQLRVFKAAGQALDMHQKRMGNARSRN